MSNSEWQLKGVYLTQTATVAKLLNEGWQPFWGYRCKHNDKETVRMYFRKAPFIEPVELPVELEAEPPVMQIDMSSEFAQLLHNLPDRILEAVNKFMSLNPLSIKEVEAGWAETKNVSGQVIHHAPDGNDMHTAMTDPDSEDDEIVDPRGEDVLETLQKMRETAGEYEAEQVDNPPAGEGFRVVDDIPADLPIRSRTYEQDALIEALRKSSDVNLTINAVDQDGNVKIFMADEIITIWPDGKITKEKNPARRDSTVV